MLGQPFGGVVVLANNSFGPGVDGGDVAGQWRRALSAGCGSDDATSFEDGNLASYHNGGGSMKKPTLTPDMLEKKIHNSMKRYSKFNFLESYAVFMGKAQLVEFGLKRILRKRYRYGDRRLERMTLGVAIADLERLGMRKDFVWQARQLNRHRVKMASCISG